MSNILKGYMKVFARTLQQDGLDAIYTEQWRNPRKRFKLLNKPRRYVIHIYLVDNKGDKEVTKLAPTEKITKEQLSQVIHKYLNELLEEFETKVNISKSYLTIRA